METGPLTAYTYMQHAPSSRLLIEMNFTLFIDTIVITTTWEWREDAIKEVAAWVELVGECGRARRKLNRS